MYVLVIVWLLSNGHLVGEPWRDFSGMEECEAARKEKKDDAERFVLVAACRPKDTAITTPVFTSPASQQMGANGMAIFTGITPTTKPNSNLTIFAKKQDGSVRKLTEGMAPILAASGKWFVYTDQIDDPYRRQLWTMNTDGTGKKQVTFPVDANYPDANAGKISPDESMIAFFGGKEEDRVDPQKQSIFTYGYRNIWVASADGSNRRRLTDCEPVRTQKELEAATKCIVADNPLWTPDGQTVTFDTLWSPKVRPNARWAIDLDGSNFRPATPAPR